MNRLGLARDAPVCGLRTALGRVQAPDGRGLLGELQRLRRRRDIDQRHQGLEARARQPRPSMRVATSTGFWPLPLPGKLTRFWISAALDRRSSGVLARIFTRSRKTSRAQAISAGPGAIDESARRSRASAQSRPSRPLLSCFGGRPVPKWLVW